MTCVCFSLKEGMLNWEILQFKSKFSREILLCRVSLFFFSTLQDVTITRPKISFAVNRVCQFTYNPLDTHWKVVKQILRYLCGLHMRWSSSLNFICFSNAYRASNWDDRKSTMGYCIYLGCNLVTWCAKK